MKILSPEETTLCRRAARMEPDMAGWLLCASWLADQGGAVDAELVRVYVELRQGPPPGEWWCERSWGLCTCRGCQLRRRERLLKEFGDWYVAARKMPGR